MRPHVCVSKTLVNTLILSIVFLKVPYVKILVYCLKKNQLKWPTDCEEITFLRWVELLLPASFPPQDYLGTEYLLLSAVQSSRAGGVNNTNTPPVHPFGMWAFHHFITGHSVGGGAPFIPLKAA